jgi:hypothetical protein
VAEKKGITLEIMHKKDFNRYKKTVSTNSVR